MFSILYQYQYSRGEANGLYSLLIVACVPIVAYQGNRELRTPGGDQRAADCVGDQRAAREMGINKAPHKCEALQKISHIDKN